MNNLILRILFIFTFFFLGQPNFAQSTNDVNLQKVLAENPSIINNFPKKNKNTVKQKQISENQNVPNTDNNLKINLSQAINQKNINEKSILEFKADSDSFLVKGLLAIIIAIFSMKTPEDILKIDHLAELKKLNLQENISQQRSNGLRAVITRVISEAQKRV